MTARAIDYAVVPAESACPTCGAATSLLMRPNGRAPSFYLCPCGFVGQVGVGPVRYGVAPAKAERMEQAKLRGLEQYVDRLALCPGHRDKATGRCIVCQAEERGAPRGKR